MHANALAPFSSGLQLSSLDIQPFSFPSLSPQDETLFEKATFRCDLDGVDYTEISDQDYAGYTPEQAQIIDELIQKLQALPPKQLNELLKGADDHALRLESKLAEVNIASDDYAQDSGTETPSTAAGPSLASRIGSGLMTSCKVINTASDLTCMGTSQALHIGGAFFWAYQHACTGVNHLTSAGLGLGYGIVRFVPFAGRVTTYGGGKLAKLGHYISGSPCSPANEKEFGEAITTIVRIATVITCLRKSSVIQSKAIEALAGLNPITKFVYDWMIKSPSPPTILLKA